MNYWLVKSEPSTYSFDRLLKEKKVIWDGVRNYTARNNLRSMKKGDLVLFYHSNEGLEIVGLTKVIKEHFQDPTTDNPAWIAVELAPVQPFKHTVSLTQLKADDELRNMVFVRQGRLSVSPVTESEYLKIMEMSE